MRLSNQTEFYGTENKAKTGVSDRNLSFFEIDS